MSIITPSRRLRSVTDVNIDMLVASGVRCVLLDRDNTCVPRDTKTPPAEVLEWLDRARAAGLATCIVSNNFHTDEVEASARELGCACVHHAMKPAPFAVRRALRLMGCRSERAVLIGDQVFTDVIAGNLAGVRTILVDPQSTTDLWYTQIFRIFERLVLPKAKDHGAADSRGHDGDYDDAPAAGEDDRTEDSAGASADAESEGGAER